MCICYSVTVCVCIDVPSTFGCKNTCTYAHTCTYILHTCTFILHTCKNTCKIKLCTYYVCIFMYMHVSVCILCISSAVSISMYLKKYVYACLYRFQHHHQSACMWWLKFAAASVSSVLLISGKFVIIRITLIMTNYWLI